MYNSKSAVEKQWADNRIFPETRVVAAAVIPFLVAAFIILFFFPGESGRLFAWDIRPNMTALSMGAGYLGGAYFFWRVLSARRWHHVGAGFLPVSVFTSSMFLATLLHWQRFDLQHPPFQIWLALYVATPFLITGIWLRNRVTDPGMPEPDDVEVPTIMRKGMGLTGSILLVSTILSMVWPELTIRVWPWELTPLTARVLGGWFSLLGVGGLLISREARWSSWRIGFESIFLWFVLVLIGVIFHAGDLAGGAQRNLFLAISIAGPLAMLLVYWRMETRRKGREF